MIIKIWFSSILILVSLSAFAQNNNCGLKMKCDCDRLNETVAYAYEYSDVIFQGTIINLDTASISEIISTESISDINQNKMSEANCARKVLRTKKVIRARFKVHEIYKGKLKTGELVITTPFDETSCSYSNFKLNENYLVYATENETADIYFMWTFEKEYFKLNPAYSIWTNKCKRTKTTDEEEIKVLKALKKETGK